MRRNPLSGFSLPVSQWFEACFEAPTPAQQRAWPVIRAGRSALLVAPTGFCGKTLAAFMNALDHLLFSPGDGSGVRTLYLATEGAWSGRRAESTGTSPGDSCHCCSTGRTHRVDYDWGAKR